MKIFRIGGLANSPSVKLPQKSSPRENFPLKILPAENLSYPPFPKMYAYFPEGNKTMDKFHSLKTFPQEM